MHLHIVRHGETSANAQGRYLGALDIGLNARGQAQAEALRAQLPLHIDAVILSPLLRARQTAQIMFRDGPWALQTIDGFRERNVGVFEGLTQQQAREQYADLWTRNITRQWRAAPTHGESIAEVVWRVGAHLNALIEAYARKLSCVGGEHHVGAHTAKGQGCSQGKRTMAWAPAQRCLLMTRSGRHATRQRPRRAAGMRRTGVPERIVTQHPGGNVITGQPINVDRPTEEENDNEKGGDFYQECNKQVINKGYKKYRIYVHTSDIPFDGMFRGVYTVLDQDGKHLVLDFVQDVEQGKACTKAWNAAKLFVNSLKK